MLASIIRLTGLFFNNALIAIANITDIIKDIELMRSLMVTNEANIQQVLGDLQVIADTFFRLFNTVIPIARK